jgi:microcystin-dependent protein
MLKRFFLILALAAGLPASALASGTIPFSLSQQFDANGKPLINCFFYTIQAGTTSTPQNAYQDSALTLLLPNPMRCDGAGRLPQFFLADGLIKIRITDQNGVSQAYPNGANGIDNIQVIGPSSGSGGGGGTVDPTTIAATGDVKASYTTNTMTGWVRMNGRTIGSAVSGATERSNADTQALFVYLWNNDPTLAVPGGRGASAIADYTSNHQITLPDLRGRSMSGMDDMGATDSGRLASSALTAGRLTLGYANGESTHTLTAQEIPSITSSGAVGVTSNTANVITGTLTTTLTSGGTGANFQGLINGGASSSTLPSNGSVNISSTNTGGVLHNNMQPTMLITFFMKL